MLTIQEMCSNIWDEHHNAVAKYPPEEWARYSLPQMKTVFLMEFNELLDAIERNDLNGAHGIIKEGAQAAGVICRIVMELERRAGNGQEASGE